MSSRWLFTLLFLLAPIAFSQTERTVHRLIGGHINSLPDLDDAELIITSSAGGGREGKQSKKGDDSGGEEKKTLSQQVADGKYGLIQKELFTTPVKKPGVISYEANPDVPKDNINNLGGLNKNDIWLAENHLLVIKGGAFPAHDSSKSDVHPIWSPIDDYKAPGRQVKIPANPKVPPPFPVQLTEDGPLQILGTNYTTTLNGSFAAQPYPLPPPEGGFFSAYSPGNQYPSNTSSGETPFPIPPYPPATGDFPPFAINGSLPPFFASLPPGAAILPPPGNITDPFDDDDPSIYYPPPYSFYYQMDNSTIVPPGPLVPGIVLPPPPDFFAPLEKQRKKPITSTTTTTYKPPIIYRITPTTTTTESIKQIRPTTSPLPPTPFNKHPSKVKPYIPPQTIPSTTTTTTTHSPPRIVTILPVRFHSANRTFVTTTLRPYNVPVQRIPERPRKKPESVTILRPVKPSTTTRPPPIYFYENNEVNNEKPYPIYAQPVHPTSRGKTSISSTQIPLRAYYSTANDIDTNSVTQSPDTYYAPPQPQQPKTTKSPAQYYFYEEEPVTNNVQPSQRAPKQKPLINQYYNIPKEYFIPAAKQPPPKQQQQQQYYYVTSRPSRPSRYRFIETTKKPQSADTFSLHVARLKQQIHQYYTTPDPYDTTNQRLNHHQSSPKPIYQFSFQAANYQSQPGGPHQHQQQQSGNPFRASPVDNNQGDQFRPMNKYSVQIQPAIEVLPTQSPIYQNTPSPVYYHQQKPTERPYYTSPRSNYDYEDEQINVNRNPKSRYVVTPKPISEYSFEATPNPIYQPYYTKQEDPYFDDITKKYFTIFGKKIPSVTTPLSNIEASTQRPRRPSQQQQQHQHQHQQQAYHQNQQNPEYVRPRPQYTQYIQQQSPQLQGDINVNYKHPRPPINSDAEIVEAIPVKISPTSGEGKPGSFISYELPGDDGAHFYFLTPQLAQSRDQGAGYYYENPNAQRIK